MPPPLFYMSPTPRRVFSGVAARGCIKFGPFIRTLSGPVLRDTARLSQRYPPIVRYGVFDVSTWPIGVRYPLPPFLSVSPLESMRSGGAIPPLKRGTSAIPVRYPKKTRQKGAIPPSAILSRKGIARYGGVSRTGPLSSHSRENMKICLRKYFPHNIICQVRGGIHFGVNTCRACIRTRANTENNYWQIICALVLCQGIRLRF